ncbi:ABC transporter permease [Ruminococcus gauvreauii]|uniref:ABC transporter permease n=1 Tax=Ruminococcus gauvreauii TaxID=438033 RepID=A0ABY5VJ05_9FIRM|nr:ABC transporter permease [Ruminococcus gauvreauii]UWP60564.1 ABC transporter permease [Ruminococcus gauvreauii]
MGNLIEYIKMAIHNIMANKGRSLLTMLGIIIGIASVIMIMAVGAGTTNQMNDEMDSAGGGQIQVMCSDDAMTAGEYMTPDDMQAIMDKVPGVEAVSPSSGWSGETSTGKGEFSISLTGATENQPMFSTSQIKRGHYFTAADVSEARRVCVISDSDAKRLFGSDDVVGMDIDVTYNGVTKSYQIVGVTQQPENGAFVSYTYEGMPVYIDVPYTSLQEYDDTYDQFYYFVVLADKTMDSQEISNKVVKVLESCHQSAGEDYYQVQSFQDIMKTMNSMMGVVTAFISCVAGISLLVGGIGVMNIMLVSVTERTREIGIRKSLGAKTSSIMAQFLAESAILTILGGIIGIILGLAGAFGICSVINSTQNMNMTPGLSATTILGATLFSCAVGIFFGIYPARKAAKLSPIEALRRN